MFRPARFAAISSVLIALALPLLDAQISARRSFAQVPFDQWLTEPDHKGIHWNIRVDEPELSNHQRLVSRLEVAIDGAELLKRRGEGNFVILMQISDEHNHQWRDSEAIDLARVPASARNSDAVYYRNFFVLPGDYQIVIAAYQSGSQEHSLARRKLHVSPLRNDPLPGAWDGLPAVEFVRLTRNPENWYLPFVRNRVSVAAEPKRPVRVEVLLNVSPNDSQAGSARVRSRNLSALLPSFKVLAHLRHENTVLNASVVNLNRQQVVFEQKAVERLDWRKLIAAIDDDKPGIIDVKALENRHSSPQFFADEVLRRLNAGAANGEAASAVGESGDPFANEARAVIILTSPVTFEDGADLRPLEVTPQPGSKIFYLRYQPLATVQLSGARRPPPRHGPSGMIIPPRAGYGPVWDQLESVLKTSDPKVFDIATPEQFRKALAAVLAEIAKM